MTGGHPAQASVQPARGSGVTGRALLIAAGALAAIMAAALWVEVVWARLDWTTGHESLGAGCPPIAPVVALFLITALMAAPGLRRIALSRRELLVVYCLLLVSAPLLSHGVLVWMIVKSIAYYYTARAQPIWETLFLAHVPAWFAPTEFAAVEGFFEGRAPVPWSLWWTPLAAWAGFMIALFGATLCLMSLLQRQWITGERLTFPIAQIPLEMVRDADGHGRAGARLPRGWAFWLGLLVSLSITFLSSLSERVPALPRFPVGPGVIVPWQPTGPLAGLGDLSFLVWPWMIAITYLIPKELSFSCWFFWLVRLALHVAAVTAGATPQRPEDWWSTAFPAPYYQGGGALLALLGWSLWVARPHLGHAARAALRPRGRGEDAGEPIPYRWAFLGFAGGCAFMVYFLWAAGCRIVFAAALVALIIAYFATWARLRAETGLGFLCFPIQIQDLMLVPFGVRALRVSELVSLISTRWAYTPGFGYSYEVTTGAALETFKIADSARIDPRRLTLAAVGAFLLALAAGSLSLLAATYHYGWFGMGVSRIGWIGPQSIGDGGRIVNFLTNPALANPDLHGLAALGAGAAVVVVLGMMRLRFWWWPFHPVGYLAANTWGMQVFYMPFFIGWLAKTLVVRYGGLRLYRATVPLAIGLVLGDLLNGALWALVGLLTAGRF